VEIVKTLRGIKRAMGRGTKGEGRLVSDIEKEAYGRLAAFPEFQVEYVAIRDAKTLKPIKSLTPKPSRLDVRDLQPKGGLSSHAVALIAARIGGVRLIDNMLL
jgi:pantothenate synthetase